MDLVLAAAALFFGVAGAALARTADLLTLLLTCIHHGMQRVSNLVTIP